MTLHRIQYESNGEITPVKRGIAKRIDGIDDQLADLESRVEALESG